MAEIAVNFLLERLGTYLVKEAELFGGIREEIDELRQELESIKSFLKDADRKRDKSEGIKTWVNQVRRVAYDIEDVIDEFLLRFGRRHAGHGGIKNFLCILSSAMTQLLPRHNLANDVQKIKRKVAAISERRGRYGMEMLDEDRSSGATIRQWQDYREANFLEEAEVVGIEEDVELLVNQLVGVTGNIEKTYISVFGMGGLGKTTLVRKVYNEPKVKEHFNCSAWVSVSQSFNTKTLLKFMLIEFGEIREPSSSKEAEEKLLLSREKIEHMDEVDLGRKIHSYLQGKRFILVLDDVWDKSVCININSALPENNNGSAIMITTRIEGVTSELETIRSVNFIRRELKTFRDELAMSLLCRKAFPGTAIMPLEFEEVGKSMLQKCRGLPLAIVTLGGILGKKRTVSEWKKVNQNLKYLLGNCEYSTAKGSVTSILKLSYDELPLHLKPCFLYCGLFPQDHLIERNKLIRLWVAEGFIEEKNGATAEEVGEDYMQQLIDRSMLQIADMSIDGRVKSCRIHDLMRDLSISISQEEEFSFILDMLQVRKANVINHRRMSVIGENNEIGNNEESVISAVGGNIQLLRSLLFFHAGCIRTPNLISYSGQFMLLRVLDLDGVKIEKLPKQIGHLLHLRYLCLRLNSSLKQLPRSIGSLQNLETLDIRDTGIRMLPNEFIRLRNLRHLCARSQAIQTPKGVGNLRCLQTLTGMDCSRKGLAAEIRQLKELRRLEIQGVKEEDAEDLYASISSLRHLSSLFIEHDDAHFPFGKRLLQSPPPHLRVLTLIRLPELPDNLGSFDALSSLTLSCGPLSEDPFPLLQSLPCLSDLFLLELHKIKRLECGPSGFAGLLRFRLRHLKELETVILGTGRSG